MQEDVDAVAISGVRNADGFPLEFGTISVSDGISIIWPADGVLPLG